MKSRLVFFFKYYVYWLVLMLIQKPVFMLSQYARMGDISALDWWRVLAHAFPLDWSVASYIAVFFGLLMVVSFFVPARLIARLSDGYTAIILLLDISLFCADIGVFPYWGFHLDKSIFVYMSAPQEMFACAPWWQWIIAGLTMIGLSAGCFWLYRLWMRGLDQLPAIPSWRTKTGYAAGLFLLTACLFLPIRGSVTTSTMNTGRVYFSDNQMLNLSAVNPLFNLVESMSGHDFNTRKYTYMDSATAQEKVAELLPSRSNDAPSVLTNTRPNIVLFILESFSTNAWQAMPCLQSLAKEGMLFSHVAASSFRTDRGVVAVLSGFPGQPTSSLMLVPAKSHRLPQLSKSLAQEGYALKFWYGGDEDFTNMRSYLIDGGFIDRVKDHSFPLSQRLSKWGVPDHVLFPLVAEEIAHRTDSTPTLDVVLSLSSHEPFEVSTMNRFDNPYLNSIAYTDSCLGAFADSLKACGAWNNTLLVMVADHGYPYPAGVQNHEPRRYAIPVVWSGGVISAPHEISTLCSQIDVVPTLLAQMKIDYSAYIFGKNILDTTSVPFAFYSFNDGFALLTQQDSVVIDAKSNRRIMGEDEDIEERARAFMQRVMEAIEAL